MSVDYYVAVEQERWPTPAAINHCVAELHYPIKLVDIPEGKADKPLREIPQSMGLFVDLEGKEVPLETSIVQLAPGKPYAYGLLKDAPVTAEKTFPDGTKAIMYGPLGTNSFAPKDLNADLKGIGVPSPHFKNGDYVLTLSFRSEIAEYRAGSYLMAGLIKCFGGLGFELQGPSFGTFAYADALARSAADTKAWK